MPAQRIVLTLVIGLALIGFSLALAADFTQPERNPEFIKSCRRQDSLLKHAFGDLVPTAVNFSHRGSFKAVVYRLGLPRPLTLVPAQFVPYASAEEFRSAARKKAIVVGALNITYPLPEANVIPGAHILLYDGVELRVLDAHGYAITDFDVQLGELSPEARVDPAIGSLDTSAFSLANITPEGQITLYLQLRPGNRELRTTKGFVKLALTAQVPGLVQDDDSPATTLAKPKVDDEGMKQPGGE